MAQRSRFTPDLGLARSRPEPLNRPSILRSRVARIALVTRLTWPLVATATLALVTPEIAHAQSKKPPPPPPKDPKIAEAKKLFDEGSAAYSDGKYEDAVKAWEKSYELSQKPLIFESIASAYERMGDKKKAREYLAKWREAAPKDEQEQLDARIKNLDARIAAAEKEEAARKEAEEKRNAAGSSSNKAAEEEAKAQNAARSSRLKIAIGVGAAGVVAVGAGIVLDVLASGQRPNTNTDCSKVGDKTLCKESAKGGIESSSTLALAGDISWIAGAVIVAGGAALIITLPPAAKAPSAAPSEGGKDAPKTPEKGARREPSRWISVAPLLSPTSGGVGVTGRF